MCGWMWVDVVEWMGRWLVAWVGICVVERNGSLFGVHHLVMEHAGKLGQYEKALVEAIAECSHNFPKWI